MLSMQSRPPHVAESERWSFYLDSCSFDFRVIVDTHDPGRGLMQRVIAEAEARGFLLIDPEEQLPDYNDDGTMTIYLVPTVPRRM